VVLGSFGGAASGKLGRREPVTFMDTALARGRALGVIEIHARTSYDANGDRDHLPGSGEARGGSVLIKPMVGVRVVHRLADRYYVVMSVTKWQETVEWVERPQSGVRSARMKCAACGKMVGFRLCSEAATRKRRTRMLYGALWTSLGFIAFAMLISIGDPPSGWSEYLSALLIAFLVGTPWLYFALKEHGVIADRKRKNGPHGFTPLEFTRAIFAPEPYGYPERQTIVFDD
jgi:hypothetical protein